MLTKEEREISKWRVEVLETLLEIRQKYPKEEADRIFDRLNQVLDFLETATPEQIAELEKAVKACEASMKAGASN